MHSCVFEEEERSQTLHLHLRWQESRAGTGEMLSQPELPSKLLRASSGKGMFWVDLRNTGMCGRIGQCRLISGWLWQQNGEKVIS